MGLTFRLLGRVIDLTTLVAGLALVLMMTHIAIDVVAKYIFQVPMPGTITVVSNYYMILVAFLPLAFAERRNGQISVEVVTAALPMRTQRGLNVAGMVFCLLVFSALAWQGWIEAGRAQQVGSFEIEQNTKLLTWPARYLLPLGCGLIALTLVAKIWVALTRRPPQSLDEPFF
ncbi:TRAP transporter small permease [Seohaeicola zhoushanensis]|uniref:TRAP transporter small permease protein n=1 Tax=Seohaeicola zhoushanensis TaxID=1569283 RepID=A0A8J3M9F5_9RHOB|nr:TRAP transporter small permease [Seohaeicola zhoushanensis]GHF67369.1 hypothetical protein GCM10017056_43270 [Seohaeicola zhoushanensis]